MTAIICNYVKSIYMLLDMDIVAGTEPANKILSNNTVPTSKKLLFFLQLTTKTAVLNFYSNLLMDK